MSRKEWIEVANQYGGKRLMPNQDQAEIQQGHEALRIGYNQVLANLA